MNEEEIKRRATLAAKRWFHETQMLIEQRRAETGNSFADAALVNLRAAEEKLAAMIAYEFTPF